MIYVYPIDISKLKSGVRRTAPPPLEAQKIRGGDGYFTWSGEIFLNLFLPSPPQMGKGLELTFGHKCLRFTLGINGITLGINGNSFGFLWGFFRAPLPSLPTPTFDSLPVFMLLQVMEPGT